MKTEPFGACFWRYFYFWCRESNSWFSSQRTWHSKKKLASDLIKQVPGTPWIYWDLKNQLNKWRDRQEPTDNNNNNLSPPLSPSAAPPGSGPEPFQPPPPPSGGFFEPFQPPPPRSDNSFGNFYIPAELSPFNNRNSQGFSWNLFGSQTQTLTRKKEKLFRIISRKNQLIQFMKYLILQNSS